MSKPKDEYQINEPQYPSPEPVSASTAEERGLLVRQGLDDLQNGRWAAAEQRFTDSLTRRDGRGGFDALAVIGVAQARLFGRGDVRGSFAMFQSLLARESSLDGSDRVRLHVLAALVFGSADLAFHDDRRAREHAGQALRFLPLASDADLPLLAAAAELLLIAQAGQAEPFSARCVELSSLLADADQPVTHCLRLELEAMAALATGDAERERGGLRLGLEHARQLGFQACESRLLLRSERRRLDACAPVPLVVPADAPAVAGAGVGTLPAPLQLQIRKLAPSRVSVFVRGGSDRLKLQVARALHDQSPRSAQPFVTLECAGLDSEALELRLFGGPAHLAGSGVATSAQTGTLYVSAIEELPLLSQPRFLRFLDQERQARVVVSSRVALERRIDEGAFRRDLGERLLLVQLVLPGAKA